MNETSWHTRLFYNQLILQVTTQSRSSTLYMFYSYDIHTILSSSFIIMNNKIKLENLHPDFGRRATTSGKSLSYRKIVANYHIVHTDIYIYVCLSALLCELNEYVNITIIIIMNRTQNARNEQSCIEHCLIFFFSAQLLCILILNNNIE